MEPLMLEKVSASGNRTRDRWIIKLTLNQQSYRDPATKQYLGCKCIVQIKIALYYIPKNLLHLALK